MKYGARQWLLGVGVLLPTLAMPADLDEVTIQVIDLDAERPEAVTRQIELPHAGRAGPEAEQAGGSAASEAAGPKVERREDADVDRGTLGRSQPAREPQAAERAVPAAERGRASERPSASGRGAEPARERSSAREPARASDSSRDGRDRAPSRGAGHATGRERAREVGGAAGARDKEQDRR